MADHSWNVTSYKLRRTAGLGTAPPQWREAECQARAIGSQPTREKTGGRTGSSSRSGVAVRAEPTSAHREGRPIDAEFSSRPIGRRWGSRGWRRLQKLG